MRPVLRLLALLATLVVAVPVALADKPDNPGNSGASKPENTGKPDSAGKPDGTGKPDNTGKPENAGKPAKDEKVAPGQQKKDAEDVPEHPLGGAPGQLKEPGQPAHPEHTKLAETAGATPTTGEVFVRKPGTDEFVALTAGAPLPMGTVVDATDGLVEIGTEAPGGVEQNAVVTGGVFAVEQRTDGLTDLTLEGGDFSTCRKNFRAGRRPAARTAAARRGVRKQGKGRVTRGLWAAGKGRFRTNGHNATASVRGTRWAIVDRCNSTTVKVFDGVVDVFDKARGKTIAVRAGERHVARERRG